MHELQDRKEKMNEQRKTVGGEGVGAGGVGAGGTK